MWSHSLWSKIFLQSLILHKVLFLDQALSFYLITLILKYSHHLYLMHGSSEEINQLKGEERKNKEEQKEMERTLLLSFFSCLTQLSDFALKFKTVDQTARGTLYFCQETIWYLSVALLHASNTEPCLSVGPAYGAMCKKIAKFISDCTHGCCPGFTALYQFKKKKKGKSRSNDNFLQISQK